MCLDSIYTEKVKIVTQKYDISESFTQKWFRISKKWKKKLIKDQPFDYDLSYFNYMISNCYSILTLVARLEHTLPLVTVHNTNIE